MPDIYIRMVARQVAAQALRPDLPTEIEWENYPDIGEFDWESVVAEVKTIAETLAVESYNYDHAYAHLAARADGGATPHCDHTSHLVTEDDGRLHWRCLRCGQITEPVLDATNTKEDARVSPADLALLARWFIAEGGTLQEFVDCLEKPHRWQAEIHAAQSLADATRDWEGS